MSDKQTKKKKFWKSFFNWLIGRESDRWEVYVNQPGWSTSVNSIASPPDGLPFWKARKLQRRICTRNGWASTWLKPLNTDKTKEAK